MSELQIGRPGGWRGCRGGGDAAQDSMTDDRLDYLLE